MKRSTFAILFTILITFSCVFASCNARDVLKGHDTSQSDTESNGYAELIKELEDQIIELKQDQYISESKREQEILRLEKLILELKQDASTDTGTGTESDTNTDNKNDNDDKNDGGNENDEPTGKFLYTLNGDEATITGYTGNEKLLTLPSSIDGHEITRIADDAFTSSTLETVVIPEGVTKIGWFAFKDCASLRSVSLPKSVTSIGYSAFPQHAVGFSLICPANSFAAQYAESYGLSFMLI